MTHPGSAQAAPTQPAQPFRPSLAGAGLLLSLTGAALLPQVPIWTAAFSLVALVWVWGSLSRAVRLPYLLAWLACAGLFAWGWLERLVDSPLLHLLNGFIFVYGVPVGAVSSGAALVLQALSAGTIAAILWPGAHWSRKLFIATATLFCTWTLASAFYNGMGSASADGGAIFIAAAVWTNWSVVALLALGLFRTEDEMASLARALVIVVAIASAGMLAQLLLRDFSYVLTARALDDFFFRVRGSYYYHAPATQLLAVLLPLTLAASLMGKRMAYVAAVLASVLVVANSTRGISLALLVGMSLLCLLMTLSRRWLAAGLALVLVLVLSTQIFYTKPETVRPEPSLPASIVLEADGGAIEGAVPEPDLSAAIEPSSAADLAAANNMRSALGRSGLSAALAEPVLGQGPGNARLQLEGNQSSKAFETSSHVLLLDMAVMGGLPASAAFIGLLAIAGTSSLVLWLIHRRRPQGALHAGLAASILVYALTSLFHPQERSAIIEIVMILAGASMPFLRARDEAIAPSAGLGRLVYRCGLVAGTLGFCCWLVLSSASYVFPTIEFLARYSDTIRERESAVLTTSPALAGVLQAGMKLTGVPGTVGLVADDPTSLPDTNAFIVWNPADEGRYPRLREALGYPEVRRLGQWMGINLPASWWLLDNYQPVIQFLSAGEMEDVGVLAGASATTAVSPGDHQPFALELADGPAALMLASAVPGTANINLRGADGRQLDLIVHFNVPVVLPADMDRQLSVRITNVSAPASLQVGTALTTFPSISHLSQLSGSTGGEAITPERLATLADLSDQSWLEWHGTDNFVIEVSTPASSGLRAYRLQPAYSGAKLLPLPTSWTVEASQDDGRSWVQIDQRNLGSQDFAGWAFTTGSDVGATLFRFTFAPGTAPGSLGMRELELFPVTLSKDTVTNP